MRFGVLGPLAVWSPDGKAVTIRGLKVRALLADLLVHEGHPASADRLQHDLWAGELPGNPAAALQAKVSQLRRSLDDAEPGARELVMYGPAGYTLRVEPRSVDAGRFTALAAQASERPDAR
jgi:DNA-binding SARP family transcriptional activator